MRALCNKNALQTQANCVDPPRITALTLSARCCRRQMWIDKLLLSTDGRTPDRYIDPAPHSVRAGSTSYKETPPIAAVTLLQVYSVQQQTLILHSFVSLLLTT